MDSEFVKRFMNQLGTDDNLFIVALDSAGTVSFLSVRLMPWPGGMVALIGVAPSAPATLMSTGAAVELTA